MPVRPKFLRGITGVFALALILYLAAAYVIAPNYWRHYEHQPFLEAKSMMTTTALGLPGDALNVGLEGESDEISCAMLAAGWRPADPITLNRASRSPAACSSVAPTRRRRSAISTGKGASRILPSKARPA